MDIVPRRREKKNPIVFISLTTVRENSQEHLLRPEMYFFIRQ